MQDVGDGSAATDLGLVGNVAGDTLTGGDINYLGAATALAQLNDGRGVRTAGAGWCASCLPRACYLSRAITGRSH